MVHSVKPQGLHQGNKTAAPDRTRESFPTSLLAGRYPDYLRKSDGMRSFVDSTTADGRVSGLDL